VQKKEKEKIDSEVFSFEWQLSEDIEKGCDVS